VGKIAHLARHSASDPLSIPLEVAHRRGGSHAGKFESAIASDTNDVRSQHFNVPDLSGSRRLPHLANRPKKLSAFRRGRASALATREPRSSMMRLNFAAAGLSTG